MNNPQYQEFTELLTASLSADQAVIGLVALGLMARQDYQPAQWSDHDFFVIVKSGEQERFRTQLDWLPYFDKVVFNFRETEHGLKVLYTDGHLLEFAVFDLEELQLARINRYRVLLDRGNIQSHLEKLLHNGIAAAATPSQKAKLDQNEFGQFLCNLLVGVGRYQRGEKLSKRKELTSRRN